MKTTRMTGCRPRRPNTTPHPRNRATLQGGAGAGLGGGGGLTPTNPTWASTKCSLLQNLDIAKLPIFITESEFVN